MKAGTPLPMCRRALGYVGLCLLTGTRWVRRACQCVCICECLHMCVSVCVCVCVPVLCLQALEIPLLPHPLVSVFVLFKIKFSVLHVMHITIFLGGRSTLRLLYCLPKVILLSRPPPLLNVPQFYLPHGGRKCLMLTPGLRNRFH